MHQFPSEALRAYGAVQATRSLREQEAEVYTTLSGRLRAALRSGSDMDRTRARADARRLFNALEVLVLHPSCPLPVEIRENIASVARVALADIDGEKTDFSFLAEICDNFAGGLRTRPVTSSTPTEAAAA
ncbi:MAG TPA: flagellar biosynthesis regulator FlaF [Roseomonas sp.]